MRARNARRRAAQRYLTREYQHGRWWWHKMSTAAECRAFDGTTRADWRRSRRVAHLPQEVKG